MRRSQKTIVGFILVFAAAFVLSMLAVQLLPIPGEFQKLTFFLLIPAISAVGVFIMSRTKRR